MNNARPSVQPLVGQPGRIHPCVAKVLRAPHQEIATRPTRTQLRRIQRRASTCKRSAGVFPPPSLRNRSIVGRKYTKVHATPALAQTADAMMGTPWLPVQRASPNAPSPLSAYSGATGAQNVGIFIRLIGVPTNPRRDSGGFRLHAGCTTTVSYTLAPNTSDTITA